MNWFVKYYGAHKISPVSQDIKDLKKHIARRERLYMLLGINAALFKGAEILEVGAGSGYNTLPFLLAGARVDIVEPNKTGQEAMINLFQSYNINPSQYTIYDCMIEQFDSAKQYDFVIAEGFLPSLDNRKMQEAVIESLVRKVNRGGGYIVVTSMCVFSYFFEDVRRMLGYLLICECTSYEERVKILSQAFVAHLESLKFASRPIDDWVKDAILNPALDTEFLDMGECVAEFCKRACVEVVGISPALVSNLSWYKDMEYSYATTIREQFRLKQHCLLSIDLLDNAREISSNQRLEKDLKRFRALIVELKQGGSALEIMQKAILVLQEILERNQDLGTAFSLPLLEVIAFLREGNITAKGVASLGDFAKAWGRGQQYISFKRIKYDGK